jgi:glutamine synthetase
MLAAALDGIDRRLECPKPLNHVNVYELTDDERKSLGVAELPGSLGEALHDLEADAVIKSSLGVTLYEAFVRAKREEIEDYQMKVTDWEVERYLEQA